jgi:hypothetical protein
MAVVRQSITCSTSPSSITTRSILEDSIAASAPYVCLCVCVCVVCDICHLLNAAAVTAYDVVVIAAPLEQANITFSQNITVRFSTVPANITSHLCHVFLYSAHIRIFYRLTSGTAAADPSAHVPLRVRHCRERFGSVTHFLQHHF